MKTEFVDAKEYTKHITLYQFSVSTGTQAHAEQDTD